jgi:hypothetical protein
MAEKLYPKELLTFKEIIMTEVVPFETLANLLDQKESS